MRLLGERAAARPGEAVRGYGYDQSKLAEGRHPTAADLDRVTRVVRLGGFIASPSEFTQQAAVMNGASDLAVAVFGEAGRHARTTIGVPSLPADAAVEVEGMFEIA